MEEKIKNLTFIIIFGFIIVFILIIGLYFKDGKNNTDSSNNNSNSSSENTSNSEYDVSAMNKIDIDKALALFDEKGTNIIYIGRSTCSVCVQFVPILNEVQKELGFTANYLDVDTFSSIWSQNKTDEQEKLYDQVKEFTDKLDIEATANGETDTLGNLFIQNGFTPALIVIKDGKVVEGFFGYRDNETLTELLKEYI